LAYASLLKGMAHRAGLKICRSHSVAVERDSESGEIRAVRLDQGLSIEGDLFIDVSGSEALLAGAALGQPLRSCSAGFVADRILLARAPRFASTPVYAEVRVDGSGWLALHASQAATYIRYVYSSEHLGDEAALAAAGAAGASPTNARIERLDPGQRARPWTGNCVAIGAAAYRPDPLFDLELHVVQLGLVHLLSLFPVGGAFAAERDEYNRILNSTVARLQDLQSAFYTLNRYGDAGFWAAARCAETPAIVSHKIETFRARGEIPPMEDELFPADFWQALLVSMGEMPRTWPPAIDLTPADRIKQGFRRILGLVKNKVLEQPTHDAYLARLGGSEVA
jgi:tryptophan halogenase